jgi:hypothetical protein
VGHNDKDGPLVSRSASPKWLLGLLMLALLAALSLWFWGHSHPVAAAAPASGSPPIPRPPLGTAPPVKLPLRAGSASPDNIRTVDICGFGKVEIDASDPTAAFKYIGERSQNTAEKWLATLRDSDDYRARAAGLFLEGKINAGASSQPMTEPTRDTLVQLAAGAGDPAVYAMALHACDGNFGDAPAGACRQISANGWARLDPDNATPWLLLAGKARATHDTAAESDAFQHAAKAHTSDSYTFSMYGFAETALPADVSPVERSYFANEVLGIEAAQRLAQYTAASQHCSKEAVQDSIVRQQCNAVAELLLKGPTLLDTAIGASIGARVGWPAQRVNQLKMEREALMQIFTQSVPADNELWSCGGVQRGNAFLSQILRLGEMGAGRDALDRSGETVPELAQKWAESMEKIRREYQATQPTAPTD